MSRKSEKLKKKKIKEKRLRFIKNTFNIGMFLLVVLIITWILHTYVVERIEVHNHSMEPTLSSGDILLMDKITYSKKNPKRFDIVIFENKAVEDDLIKRVIGLPGECIRIVHGKIYINGELVDDIDGLEPPYEEGIAAEDFELGSDEYFVIGDNREVSIDSRSMDIGAIKRNNIVGKVFIRIKPIKKFWVK